MNEIIQDLIAKNFLIFVDTSALFKTGADAFFFRDLAPMLSLHDKKIIVAKSVVDEINKHIGHPEKGPKAKQASHIIQEYRTQDMVDFYGGQNDPFADHIFKIVFTQLFTRYNLVLITQDKDLASEISNIQDSKSVHSSKKIVVLRLTTHNNIEKWDFHSSTELSSPGNRSTTMSGGFMQSNQAFSICTEAISSEPKIIVPENIVLPTQGDYVYSRLFGTIQLLDPIAEGGEGKIYATRDNDRVCKIYLREMITDHRRDKLQLMLQRRIQYHGICWPLDMLTNTNGHFVGYVMPKALGIPLQKAMFVKPLLLKNYPHWTKKNLVALCLQILDKIQYLHQNNILIGDINPLNILLHEDDDVYFVDTDSYQIEQYPCPVGMVNYTPPELQGKSFKSVMRTLEHENFAIATLLFMILLPGKPPYSQQGGGNPQENIRNQDFSYPFGAESNQKAPEGPWRYIWSHLLYSLKEAFYECFKKNARQDVDDWIRLLKEYDFRIRQGHVSDELFPNHFKQLNQQAIVKYDKQESYRTLVCKDCQQSFSVNIEQKSPEYIAKLEQNPYCYDCYQKLQETTEEKTCVDCGATFVLTFNEKVSFERKGLFIPKRCPDCRKAKQGTPTPLPQQSPQPVAPSVGYQARQNLREPAQQPVQEARTKPPEQPEPFSLLKFLKSLWE